MKKREQPRGRVVTPEQLKRGYLERDGDVIRPRPWVAVRRLDDGNWVVREQPRSHSL